MKANLQRTVCVCVQPSKAHYVTLSKEVPAKSNIKVSFLSKYCYCKVETNNQNFVLQIDPAPSKQIGPGVYITQGV